MAFERPRGVRDFGPGEMSKRVCVEDILYDVFSSFGYKKIGTPTFEFLELFEQKSGADIRDHLYVFEDKGGRKLCLRPEMTASVARSYASDLRTLPKPLRLSYYGPMFRYEEPQKGRYREFWQAGVELFGVSGPEADAEAILVASECLQRLGLKYRLRISNIGVLRRLLELQGLGVGGQDRLIQLLDKRGLDAVKEEVQDKALRDLLGLKGSSEVVGEAIRNVSDSEAKRLLTGLKDTLSLLDVVSVPYEVDFSMARGLDYYTGMVFDVKVEGLGAQNQVCGGGRYDTLVEAFAGPSTPAVGFAFGVDRLVEALDEQGVDVHVKKPDVFVLAVSDAVRADAFRIACDIRRARPELTVEIDLAGRRLNKALQHASESGAKYSVIVGEKELEEGSVGLKDMSSKEQKTVDTDELPLALG
ncbi:MAG: histidine--tRNA ligase [Candidatus Altiarchaeales archaeon]|nr:histidine--tRNA ligase [Candidatus Altiarchaeales archaeon]MBD3415589.1 histidine--tRNA ligase [Candidatus Altiarchaeales archaeon]